MIPIELAEELEKLSKSYEDGLLGFIGQQINESTIVQIEELTRSYLRLVISHFRLDEIELSKIGVCPVASCIKEGIINFNPYTVSVFEKINDTLNFRSEPQSEDS
jgi:hypothetical protein